MPKLKRKTLYIYLLLLFLLAGCSVQSSAYSAKVQDGFINLEHANLSKPMKLDGEWEFYWGELLSTYEEFSQIGRVDYLKVPMFWHQGKIGDQTLTGKGHATYRLKLLIPQSHQNKLLGLYIPFGVESAYTLIVNGEKVASSGKVGISKQDMKGQYYPQVALFEARNENEIIIQVSNYVQRTGGLWDSVLIGNADVMISYWNNRLAKELFVAGSIVIIGLYHLGLYFIRRKDFSSLYFGAFCLLIGIRSFFLGEVYISHLLPDLNFDMSKKWDYIGQYLGPALFVLYVSTLFPKEIHKWMIQFIACFYGVLCILVLVTPATLFTLSLPLSHLVLLIYAPYIVYVFILAAIRKREGALFSCFMFLLMALTVINDVLYYNNIINTFDMAKFGLFIFVFAQAFILSIKFSKAFKSVEELSLKQSKWSQDLERLVEERTQDLQRTLEDLQITQKQLVESEKMAALGGLVAGVAHEINTPVGVSVTASSHLEQKTKEIMTILHQNNMKKSELVSYLNMANESSEIILKNLKRASELVKSFKMVAVDQSISSKRQFNLKEYISETITSLKPHIKREKHQIVLDCEEDIQITSDPGVISQIFTNLILNSLIHGFEQDMQGVITIRVYKENGLVIEFSDNGRGMTEDVREKVFHPFFTTNRSGGGTGLGLHIVYNLVTQTLGGTIVCESQLGKGTTFKIRLNLEGK